MLQIGALASGSGTNVQAIWDAIQAGRIPRAILACVISERAEAPVLQKARSWGVPAEVLRKKDFPSSTSFDSALIEKLKNYGVELVVLAGFLSILGKSVLAAFPQRILNIHPSLLPTFRGLYGIKIHQLVISEGIKVTGATVHFVTEEVDGGPIVLQKAVSVREDDTPEILQERVKREAEWVILPEAIRLFASGKLKLEGKRVRIQEVNEL